MLEIEFSEFDTSVANFEATATKQPLDDLPLPGLFGQMREWLVKPLRIGGESAKQTAEKIYATFQVVRAARGLLGATGEARAYSKAIDALNDEYTVAWAAALTANSGSYAITARLRGFAATLKGAVSRVKANTQAMNTVSEFIAGATAFVGALA